MAEHDHVGVGKAPLQPALAAGSSPAVVEHGDANPLELELDGVGQEGHELVVVVPEHRAERSQLFERSKGVGTYHVAGMQDQVGRSDRIEHRPRQALLSANSKVGVGEHHDVHVDASVGPMACVVAQRSAATVARSGRHPDTNFCGLTGAMALNRPIVAMIDRASRRLRASCGSAEGTQRGEADNQGLERPPTGIEATATGDPPRREGFGGVDHHGGGQEPPKQPVPGKRDPRGRHVVGAGAGDQRREHDDTAVEHDEPPEGRPRHPATGNRRRAQRWPYPWALRDLRSLGHYELAVEVPATSFPQVGVEEIGVNPFVPAFMTQVQFGES